jgi:hypothetical protein
MIKLRFLVLLGLLLAWTSLGAAQFAHTYHRQIVDAGGPSRFPSQLMVNRASRAMLVRSTNLGNWMAPEAYMWAV